jgi:hypothetical protein
MNWGFSQIPEEIHELPRKAMKIASDSSHNPKRSHYVLIVLIVFILLLKFLVSISQYVRLIPPYLTERFCNLAFRPAYAVGDIIKNNA